jgi:hypothetical protein
LSFVRPLVLKFWTPNSEGVAHASGIPALGSLLVAGALVLGFGSEIIALVCLVILLVDTGGIPWFVVSTWRDRALWKDAA